jgi:uncharacterized membrane protein YedE/YeeE
MEVRRLPDCAAKGGILVTLDRCPWYIAGPLFGLLMVGLRAATNKPFGALGGYIDAVQNAGSPKQLGFRGYLLAGIVLGGLLHAATLGSFSISLAYAPNSALLAVGSNPVRQATVLVIAGLVMGFGARKAGGCTSGHGMSGMAIGSPASIVSCMTFFGTAVILAHVFNRFWGTP